MVRVNERENRWRTERRLGNRTGMDEDGKG